LNGGVQVSPGLAPRLRRSILYVPGSNTRALAKAADLACDGLILDLEDAVAPARKAEARVRACEAVAAGRFPGRETVIRVNPLVSPYSGDDMVAAAAAEPDAILLPKVETAADVARCETMLSEAFIARRTGLWLMIETPRAMLEIAGLCAGLRAAGSRASVLVLGLNDLAKETRVPLLAGRGNMLSWLSQAVLAARAYGFEVLDGVFNGIGDADGFEAECRQARACGFDGKTLIHPDQIGVANAVFAPQSHEIAEAQAIVAAFADPAQSEAGVLQVNGRMVERLHLAMAERTLRLAGAAGLV